MNLMEQELLPTAAPEWLLGQTIHKTEGKWKKQGCCEIYPPSWKEGDPTPPIVLLSIRDCESISTGAVLKLCSEVKKGGGLSVLIATGSGKASPALEKLAKAADGWFFWEAAGAKSDMLREHTAQLLKNILIEDKNSFVGLAEEELYRIFQNAGRLGLANGTGATPQQAAERILQHTDLRNAGQLAIHAQISVQGSLEKSQNAVKQLVLDADPWAEGVWQLTPEKDLSGDESRIQLLFGQANTKGEEA